MEENAPRSAPSVRILILGILLGGLYVYRFVSGGSILRNLAGIVFDAVLLLLLLQLSVFFFAQFTLPVRTLGDRVRLSSRVWLHSRNANGPTVFIKNGREIARKGESERQGPGLIWVDTASAVVTWSGVGQKAVLGPGVHFTDSRQRIGRTFNLHSQRCSLGPSIDDPIFETLPDRASEEERKKHAALEAKRATVSGRTRDGNEVIPSITVVFRLDSQPSRGPEAGSRFGYSSQAVERASRAEGISADGGGSEQRRVAWNQLPGLIAADIWREYLSKFTLDELFSPNFPPLPDVPQPVEPPDLIDVPNSPLIVKRGLIVRLLRQRNNAFEKWLDRRVPSQNNGKNPRQLPGFRASGQEAASQRYTALQVVGQMLERRMTQAAVPILDECGRLLEGHTISREFKQLKDRGLAVQQVTISGLRFDPSIERQIIEHWNTDWLADAQNELKQVEQLERLAAQNGRQRAFLEHALTLGRAIQYDKPADVAAAAKSLLRATESEIVGDQALYARASEEAESVSGLIRWVESGKHD